MYIHPQHIPTQPTHIHTQGAAQALTTGLTLLHGHPPPPIPPPPPSSPTTSPPQHHHHGTPRSTYPTCIPGTSRVTDPSVGVLVHAAGCSVTHVALACVAAAVEAAAGKVGLMKKGWVWWWCELWVVVVVVVWVVVCGVYGVYHVWVGCGGVSVGAMVCEWGCML